MKVLITGGASGLGAALTSACLARGDQITVIDVAAPPDHMTADGVTWLHHDLCKAEPAQWDQLSRALEANSPYDLVVLNAGISATGRFEAIAAQDHLRVSAINLHAVVQLSARLHKASAIAAGGRLVLVSSLSYFTGYPGAASYAASKDGLVAFARSLRKPLNNSGRISVQIACPGPMDTPHAARYAPKGANAARRMDPMRVAQVILDAGPGRFWIIPGAGAKLAAAMGWLAPSLMTKVMGRVLFSKLGQEPDA